MRIAWCSILFTVSVFALQAEEVMLSDFDEASVAGTWMTVNDNVMGGRSSGSPDFKKAGVLTFKGTTNTNGGGFSSIRTKPAKWDLGKLDGLMIRVKGDGRTYLMDLRTNVALGQRNKVAYRTEFKTKRGEWVEVFLPFRSFLPTFRGMDIRGRVPKLDASKIEAFGFMIYDKKDGPFELEVDWVKAAKAT